MQIVKCSVPFFFLKKSAEALKSECFKRSITVQVFK